MSGLLTTKKKMFFENLTFQKLTMSAIVIFFAFIGNDPKTTPAGVPLPAHKPENERIAPRASSSLPTKKNRHTMSVFNVMVAGFDCATVPPRQRGQTRV